MSKNNNNNKDYNNTISLVQYFNEYYDDYPITSCFFSETSKSIVLVETNNYYETKVTEF